MQLVLVHECGQRHLYTHEPCCLARAPKNELHLTFSGIACLYGRAALARSTAPRPPPSSRLDIVLFSGLFHRGASIDGSAGSSATPRVKRRAASEEGTTSAAASPVGCSSRCVWALCTTRSLWNPPLSTPTRPHRPSSTTQRSLRRSSDASPRTGSKHRSEEASTNFECLHWTGVLGRRG